MRIDREHRRAALVATAITAPLVVLVLLVIAANGGSPGGSSSGSAGALPPLTVPAPPHAAAEATPCAKVLAELPVALGRLQPRVVHTHPDTPYVVAWGDPALVLACGAAKPEALHPGSSEELFNAGSLSGPFYLVSGSKAGNVYTIIDRAPYVTITVPARYHAVDYLPTLVGAVGKALPTPVCSTDPQTPDPDRLCTRRTS